VAAVKDEERTVGIEVHDVVVQGRNVMVWDHGGQLEVSECILAHSPCFA
jgi:hypothetical protein